MTEYMNLKEVMELAHHLLETISMGFVVIAQALGGLPESNSWWFKRLTQPGLTRSRALQSPSPLQAGFLFSSVVRQQKWF